MKKNLIIVTAFLINVMLLISSCQKSIDKPFAVPEESSKASNNNSKENEKKVYVSTLDELYAAVNNPDNLGTDVILAAGTYVLSSSYPNGGRLELQTDMSLKGQPGQTDAVLIDQSALPFASFRLSPTVSVAPIRIGRGTNSLEWLSVKGGAVSANPLSVIESDLIGNETNVTISHVYVDCNGSRTGILIRNRLDEHANRVINATLVYNEITNAFTNNNPPGAGLALQNRISGAQIKLNMKGNYIHGCRVGVLNFNAGLSNSIENCKLDLTSHNDRIEGNGSGLDLGGGSGAGIIYGNINTTTVKMYGTTIQDNGQSQFPPNNGAFLTGISAAAGWNTASNNNLTVSLWGCNISNNNGTDIHANGAFSTTGFVAGTNNLLEIYLYGISANAIVDAAASIPAEPAGTNVVNVYR
jgi:hypothetical protein